MVVQILLLHFVDCAPFLQEIDLVVKFITIQMIIMSTILVQEGVGVHHRMNDEEEYDLLLGINDDKEVQVGVIADNATTTMLLLSNNHGCPIEEIVLVVVLNTREEGGRVCQLDS